MVARRELQKHNCIKSMLVQYNAAQNQLDELNKKVDDISSDIRKQT